MNFKMQVNLLPEKYRVNEALTLEEVKEALAEPSRRRGNFTRSLLGDDLIPPGNDADWG